MSTKLLTEKEVAKNYRVSVKTLQNNRVAGKGFKFVKIGGKVLYREKDMEEFIERNLFSSTTEAQKQRSNFATHTLPSH